MDDAAILSSFAQQYRAGLAMLRQAIEKCPDEVWLATDFRNPYWHVAYHTVFYTHFYAHPSDAEFRPWAKHRKDTNFFSERPDQPGVKLPPVEPYSREEVREYCDLCRDEISARLEQDRLEGPSGFAWLPFSRFELHVYNLRHLQHHTGQLADRLRARANIGVPWVGKR